MPLYWTVARVVREFSEFGWFETFQVPPETQLDRFNYRQESNDFVAKDLGFFTPVTVNGIWLRQANETTAPAYLADTPRLYQVFGYSLFLSVKKAK